MPRKNIGKVFEDNWKKSVSDNILYYRPPDAAQSFQMSSKLRFSQHSPCDCMMFDGKFFYTLELKSVGTSSISFERTKEDKGVIHKYQIDSLFKFSEYKNVISGFLLDFRLSDKTYFLEINEFLNLIECIDKKSFNEKDLLQFCTPIEIEKKKLKVNYRYNIQKFLEETRLN